MYWDWINYFFSRLFGELDRRTAPPFSYYLRCLVFGILFTPIAGIVGLMAAALLFPPILLSFFSSWSSFARVFLFAISFAAPGMIIFLPVTRTYLNGRDARDSGRLARVCLSVGALTPLSVSTVVFSTMLIATGSFSALSGYFLLSFFLTIPGLVSALFTGSLYEKYTRLP